MTSRRTRLLTATATAALLSVNASGAMAFDEVNWVWNNLVDQNVLIDVDITTSIDPNGLVQVEKLQMHFGDIDAQAHVSGIQNNAPGTLVDGGTETALVSGNIDYADGPIPGGTVNPITGATYGSTNPNIVVTPVAGGNVDEQNNEVDFVFQIDANFDITDLEGVHDALDLPKIENAATAVANNQSITSDVPIYLHDAQFAAGGINDFSDAGTGEIIQGVVGLLAAGLAFDAYADGNIHTALALGMTAAAAGGIIEPATVNASASVSGILNAYVENSATAVTNNASFTIESDNPVNHVVVADLTQWGYADVTAAAGVTNVVLNGYTNFGGAGMGGGLNPNIVPIVSNTATAVGNNLNIKVGAPSVD